MKRLFLIRHAKSSWSDPDLRDFERPLNKRGKRDAPVMGARLARHKVNPDLILSSPARRAFKTAKIMASEIGCPIKKIQTHKAIYLADVPTLMDVLRKIDSACETVFLFGHNPGLTMLANYLTNYYVDNIPTSGIFCIDFEIASWREVSQGNGRVTFFDYPKKHL
ncbi:histidine phosphatase family protein [candidate division KSB1 bacterium]|nr:histidine phosphatase family protein [candidate division KSB1 bacterium]